MPTYVWNCPQCGDIEVFRRMADCKVPPEHEHPVSRVFLPAHAMPDIQPYRAVTGDRAGQEISGRVAHREFLKRNRLVEVGDAPIRDTKQFRKIHKKGEIAQELKRVVPEVLRRGQG